jgi:hypothetical protein
MGMERQEKAMETVGRVTPHGLVRRFIRERKGATAIEFAILALPFFLLLFAILESCVTFAAQQLMTNATEDIARQFRTGALKPDEVDRVKIRKLLCDRMGAMFPGDCPGMDIDLRSFATFEQASRLFDGGARNVDAEHLVDRQPAQLGDLLVHTAWLCLGASDGPYQLGALSVGFVVIIARGACHRDQGRGSRPD